MDNFFIDNDPYRSTHMGVSQFAGARGDPFCNHICYIMFKDVKLSAGGSRNINYALNNLPIFRAHDERLQFGWSFDHIIRHPSLHKDGYEHFAMITVLADTFHEVFAARVIHHMAKAAAAPQDVTPHIIQIREHLRSCNGAFSGHNFSILVEDYLHLDPHNITSGGSSNSRYCRTDPKSIAQALSALCLVVQGKLQQLTLVGGATLAWFAAVAEWLYDLRVVLRSDSGAKLHDGCNGQPAQLVLVYTGRPEMEIHTESWESTKHPKEFDGADEAYSEHVHFLSFGGRVNWQASLPRVFGKSFYALDHLDAKIFGGAIGGVARGLEGLVAVENEHVSADNRSNPASFGIGLIQTLTSWFPELRRGQGRMERQLRLSPEDATDVYYHALQDLRRHCACNICSLQPKSDTPPKYGYCLAVLTETIIALGLALSRLTVAAGLFPTRQGLQEFYANQVQKHIEANAFDLKDINRFTVVYGNEWNASDARRLQNCVGIFSGTTPETDINDGLVAITHEGICAYMIRIQSPPTSQKSGSQGLIRVTGGGICYKQKVFSRMSTQPVVDEDRAWLWEEVKLDYLDDPLWCLS